MHIISRIEHHPILGKILYWVPPSAWISALRESARGLMGGLDMTHLMRPEMGIRLEPHSNITSSNKLLSTLTDDAESLLGRSRVAIH